MERLTYTNALGQSVVFSRTGTYRWTQVSDLGELNSAFQVTSSPYQDGVTSVGDSYFESRVIQLDMIIVSDNLIGAIRTLNQVLNPKLGLAKLTYERDGIKRSLDKVKTRTLPALPGGSSRGSTYQISRVTFEAFNPYYADETFNEAEVTTGGLLFEFPLEITDNFEFDFINTLGTLVTNAGDVECPITLIMDGPMSSPLEVINVTTGEKIVLTMALLENERLTITTELENTNVIKTDLNTGTETVAFQYIDVAETTFFSLAKGDNLIKIFAGEAEVEQTTIRFKQQFVGV